MTLVISGTKIPDSNRGEKEQLTKRSIPESLHCLVLCKYPSLS